ncbi:inositol 2-dehydrogenase [Deinococcus detaillensis]|uniref:Inositol 2-dehydrogenase n=1 Tax=Deinococcus detaillensis TaxID=2592048 RepID=A0A553UNR3_9DEIO|nr:inositol 2-dehydrogenase [Deinococcus detaillensis]TSA81805.1 inositol 2-dehydrogenase [Deinococcus detaillensis]
MKQPNPYTDAPIRFALLGAGRMGREHGQALLGLPRTRVVAVADPLPDAAQALAGLLRADQVYADPLDAIHDPQVQAVIIVTPTSTHAALIEAAAKAGKAIFCEKPVAADLVETERVMKIVQECGVPFQIGFQRRFDVAFAQAKQRIEAGELGTIEQFAATGRDPAPPPLEYLKVSGGIFLDQAIHDLDIARFLVGEVEEVIAIGDAKVDPAIAEMGDADTTTVLLKFVGGAQGVIQNSRRAVYGYDVRTEIFGSGGKFVLDATPKTPLLAYGESVKMDHYHFFMDRFKDAYRAEIAAFVASLQAGQSPNPGTHDALESLRLALACTQSLKEDRPVRVQDVQANP